MKTSKILLLFLLIAVFYFASYAQNESDFKIAPTQNVERQINLKETHIYEFSIDAGEFVRFEIQQKNVDPQLIISDVQDKTLREIYFDRFVGKATISFIAAEKGTYRLKIKHSGESEVNGNYRIEMTKPKPPTEIQRRVARAEIIFNDLVQKRGKLTDEQRQNRLDALQKLVAEWEKLNEPHFESATWYQIAVIAKGLKNNELTRTAFEKMLEAAKANGEVFEQSRAYYNLANSEADNGKQETAERYFLLAADFAEKSGVKIIVAEIYYRLGSFYSDSGKYQQARDFLKKAFDDYLAVGNEVRTIKSRVSLNSVMATLGEKVDSDAANQQALEIFERNDAFYDKASLLRKMGGDAADKKQFELAEKYFTEALSLMEKYGEPDDEAFILYALGLLKFTQIRYAESNQYLETARSKLEIDPNARISLRIEAALGRLDLTQGKITEALVKFKSALKIADEIGLKYQQISLNSLVSQVYLALGQTETAFQYALAAKKMSDTGDRYLLGGAANSLGRVYQYLGDYPSAIRLFEENIKIGEDDKNNDLTLIGYQALGGVYIELNDLERAEKAYLKAAELAKKSRNSTLQTAVGLSLGQVYLRQNKLAEAKKFFETSLAAAQANNDFLLVASAHQLLGNLALYQKKYAHAQAEFAAALKLQTEGKSVAGIALSLEGLGDAFAGLGNQEQARSIYIQALGVVRQIGSPTGEAVIFENLMNLEQAGENKKLAIFYGKQAVNLLQTVRGSIKPLESEIRRNFLASVEETYRMLAALLIEENRIAEAQQVLGFLKDEELYQFTRRSPTVAATVRQLDLNVEEFAASLEYKTITDQINAATGRATELQLENMSGKLTPEKIAEFQKLQTDLAALNAKFTGLLQKLTAKFGQTETKNPPELQTLQVEKWQKKLAGEDSRTVLLTTLVTENRYYVILTTATTQIVRSSEIKQTDLEQKIVRLRQVLEDPRTDVLFAAGELYEILIKPVEADLKRLNAETLLWSLDGVLRYVPFAALYDGEKFMVETYTNAVVTLAQPPETSAGSPKNWRALGAGVSIGIEDFAALSQVPAELNGIVKDNKTKGLFAGKLLLNREFTRENLTDSLKQKFQLVHFATHFVINPGKDVDSFLLFGDGDKLNLAELRTVEAFDFSGADLLTLSACETALGTPNANGAEIESFGVIAQKRGAKTVIASLWSIADNATPEIMTEFYRQYKLGNGAISKAEALRKAQIKIIKDKNRNFTHPAYWSPFIVLGDWR